MSDAPYHSEHIRAWFAEKKKLERFLTGQEMAERWENWCGETRWSRAARQFGALGGVFEYWCGMPQSASAIPLTFGLKHRDGREFESSSRLKDILMAVALLEGEAA